MTKPAGASGREQIPLPLRQKLGWHPVIPIINLDNKSNYPPK
jgi:hypothetical protein